eukprot:6472722-Amphidinium_carterae.1
MGTVKYFEARHNILSGMFPDIGAMSALIIFSIWDNYFTGKLPERGIGAMSAVQNFLVNRNRFTGALSDDSMRAMKVATFFRVDENWLKGTLADMRAMSTLFVLALYGNSFSGTLPDSLLFLTALVQAGLADNSFAGTLPSALRTWQGAKVQTLL